MEGLLVNRITRSPFYVERNIMFAVDKGNILCYKCIITNGTVGTVKGGVAWYSWIIRVANQSMNRL